MRKRRLNNIFLTIKQKISLVVIILSGIAFIVFAYTYSTNMKLKILKANEFHNVAFMHENGFIEDVSVDTIKISSFETGIYRTVKMMPTYLPNNFNLFESIDLKYYVPEKEFSGNEKHLRYDSEYESGEITRYFKAPNDIEYNLASSSLIAYGIKNANLSKSSYINPELLKLYKENKTKIEFSSHLMELKETDSTSKLLSSITEKLEINVDITIFESVNNDNFNKSFIISDNKESYDNFVFVGVKNIDSIKTYDFSDFKKNLTKDTIKHYKTNYNSYVYTISFSYEKEALKNLSQSAYIDINEFTKIAEGISIIK